MSTIGLLSIGWVLLKIVFSTFVNTLLLSNPAYVAMISISILDFASSYFLRISHRLLISSSLLLFLIAWLRLSVITGFL